MLFYIPERRSPASAGPARLWGCWDVQHFAAQNETALMVTIRGLMMLINMFGTKESWYSRVETDSMHLCVLKRKSLSFPSHFGISIFCYLFHLSIILCLFYPSLYVSSTLLSSFHLYLFVHSYPQCLSVSDCLLSPTRRSGCCVYSWQLYLPPSLYLQRRFNPQSPTHTGTSDR